MRGINAKSLSLCYTLITLILFVFKNEGSTVVNLFGEESRCRQMFGLGANGC